MRKHKKGMSHDGSTGLLSDRVQEGSQQLTIGPRIRRAALGTQPDPGGTVCKESGMGYRSRGPGVDPPCLVGSLVFEPFSGQA